MTRIGILFPGQGAQHIGMGKDFYTSFDNAKAIYDSANKILGFDLAKICFEGPDNVLSSTEISQPAIFVTSIAMWEVFKETLPGDETIAVTAGLSLGEYTALYLAGSISFEDGVNLVRNRGLYMQEASDANPSGMASLIGLSGEQVQDICERISSSNSKRVFVANLNCPGQVVVSGDTEAVAEACATAEREGAIKAVTLKVSGAFHSEFMESARRKLAADLEGIPIRHPQIPVVSNVTADYIGEPAEIKKNLITQVVSPVLWEKSVKKMIADGIDKFYEVGPGKVLNGLLKRIDRRFPIDNINNVSVVSNS